MGGEFRAQGTWLGCNGVIALAVLSGLALAMVLIGAFRLTAHTGGVETARRLTDSRDA
jgi:hypothetical protein